MLCENCEKRIRRDRLVEHVNIAQKKTTHRFCSKKCMYEWINRKDTNEKVYLWQVEAFAGSDDFVLNSYYACELRIPILGIQQQTKFDLTLVKEQNHLLTTSLKLTEVKEH